MIRKVGVGIIAIICMALITPGFTSEEAESKKEAKRIEKELKATKERDKQRKCAIMGGDITPEDSVVYMGYEIMTCCKACEEPIKKDPLSAILQIRKNDQEPYLAEGFEKQSTCPVAGNPVNDEIYTIKENKLVKFCCPDCKTAFNKEPEKYVKKMIENKQAPVLLTFEQETCPISGGEIDKDVSSVVDGKKVHFCCEGCEAPFKEKKEEYLEAMADKGIVLANAEK